MDSLLGKPVPASFSVRRIVLAPGEERAYDDAEWRGALVAVQAGAVEVVTRSRASASFARGDILCLGGLSVRTLRNGGVEPAVLLAVSRPCADEFSPGARSNGT